VELIAGMTAPAVISNDVRAMEDGDRDAIRASEDPDALLALRIQLLAANSGKWRRAVAFSIGAIGILTGVLIINLASTAVIVSLAAVLVGLFAVGAGIQSRARARAIRSAAWLGTINFRLQQLAAKG